MTPTPGTGTGTGRDKAPARGAGELRDNPPGPTPNPTLAHLADLKREADHHQALAEQARRQYHQAIAQARTEGHTLQAIGDTLGVTRERVRQLATKADPHPPRDPKP